MSSNSAELMQWITIDNCLRLSIALLASVVVFIIELFFLRKRPTTKLVAKPASFFELEDLTSQTRLKALTTLYALPSAVLFFVVALVAKPFIDASKDFLSIHIAGNIGGDQLKHSAEAALKAMPDWLNPVFVLGATLILFAPYIGAPFAFLRTMILFAMGIETRANHLANMAAKTALGKLDFDTIQKKFESSFGKDPPLAEELVTSPEPTKLAYQILYFSADKAKEDGLRSAIFQTLKTIGIKGSQLKDFPSVRYGDLLAAFTFYFVLCVAYIFFAPLAGPWLQTDPTIKSLLQIIEWPASSDVLILSVAQRTFSFVVPLAFGMQYYANQTRIREDATRALFRRVAIIFSWQFLISGLVNLLFVSLMILKRRSGEFHDAWISLADIKIWADVFTSSLAPGIALCAWIACSRLEQRWLAYLVLCFAAGLALLLGQYAYEGISKEWRGYYWHQMVLGIFITASYLCAALMARDVVSLPVDPAETQ